MALITPPDLSIDVPHELRRAFFHRFRVPRRDLDQPINGNDFAAKFIPYLDQGFPRQRKIADGFNC